MFVVLLFICSFVYLKQLRRQSHFRKYYLSFNLKKVYLVYSLYSFKMLSNLLNVGRVIHVITKFKNVTLRSVMYIGVENYL